MHISYECNCCEDEAQKHCEHCGIGYCDDCGDMNMEPIVLDGKDKSQLCVSCYDKEFVKIAPDPLETSNLLSIPGVMRRIR